MKIDVAEADGGKGFVCGLSMYLSIYLGGGGVYANQEKQFFFFF